MDRVRNLRNATETTAVRKAAIRARLADYSLLRDERALLVRELRDLDALDRVAWDEFRHQRARLEAAA